MRKSLIRVVATPVVVLVVMLGLSLTSIRVLTNLGNAALDSREVATAVQGAMLQFLNMETGLRGYIASHEPIFLEPYWKAKDKLPEVFKRLDEIIEQDEQHIADLSQLRTHYAEWIDYSERVRTTVSQTNVFASPPLEFMQLSGKTLMDRVRVSAESMIAREQERYDAQANWVRLSVQWAMYSILSLGLFLSIMVAFHLRKEILRLSDEFGQSLKDSQDAREALRITNENLEETVRLRTADLLSTNEELEAFCYSVSHDLRAPLRGIDGFSQALEEDYSATLAPEAKRYIQFIRTGIQRMGQLIDDLLTLSRLTRAETSVEEVDLGKLCTEVEQEIEAANPKRKVEFSGLNSTVVKGDRALLHAVMTNLLSNAWKFTEKVAHPKIACGMTEKEGQKTFYVTDNGAGFDMAHSPKLFGAFQRLHSAKEFPGTGVGLATVRRIIKRHGGSVWATGEVGKGATFYFTLGL